MGINVLYYLFSMMDKKDADDNKEKILTKEELKNEAKTPIKVITVDFIGGTFKEGGLVVNSLLQGHPGIDTEHVKDVSAVKKDFAINDESLSNLREHGRIIMDEHDADIIIWGTEINGLAELYFQGNDTPDRHSGIFELIDKFVIPINFIKEYYFKNVDENDNISSNEKQNIAIKRFSMIDYISEAVFASVLLALKPKNAEQIDYQYKVLPRLVNTIEKYFTSEQGLNYESLVTTHCASACVLMLYAKRWKKDKYFARAKQVLQAILSNKTAISSKRTWIALQLHLARCVRAMWRPTVVPSLKKNAKENTELLDETIIHYEKTLSVISSRTLPFEFAKANFELGRVFIDYYNETQGAANLVKAIKCFERAERIWGFSFEPYHWAEIQYCLGKSLYILSNQYTNDEMSKESINRYKNVLKVYTEQRNPVAWADAQNNLAVALYSLGRRTDDEKLLREASICFYDSLYVYEERGMDGKVAVTQRNIDKIEKALHYVSKIKQDKEEDKENKLASNN